MGSRRHHLCKADALPFTTRNTAYVLIPYESMPRVFHVKHLQIRIKNLLVDLFLLLLWQSFTWGLQGECKHKCLLNSQCRYMNIIYTAQAISGTEEGGLSHSHLRGCIQPRLRTTSPSRQQ